MKSILLIGLGRFGINMAKKLRTLRHEVLAIDESEERVNAVLPYVTNAQIGDCTKEQYVASLGVRNFDICFVTIGDDFQASLETASLLKDYGAPYVVARANSDVHAKFLLRNGADSIVYPEKDLAEWTAVRYSSKNILDYIEIDSNYSIYETNVPPSWVGKTVVTLSVRQKYNLNVLGVKVNGKLALMPGPDHVFDAKESILVLGHNKDLQKFLHL